MSCKYCSSFYLVLFLLWYVYISNKKVVVCNKYNKVINIWFIWKGKKSFMARWIMGNVKLTDIFTSLYMDEC